jgi:antitoxin component YwqK of YwqJK toxin-antitoxin module
MKRSVGRICVAIVIGVLLLGLLTWAYAFIKQKCRSPAGTPLAAEALEHILKGATPLPITGDILELNDKRRIVGLAEVNPRWSIAPIGLYMEDGPSIRVLLDERGQPAKVILGPQRGWGGPPCIEEYEVADGKLNGKAATWWGSSLLLSVVERYKDSTLQGLTEYFSENGVAIASCVFRKGKPWNGRALGRNGFEITWDISYRDGKLNGAEILYKNGQMERLRTFGDGVPHGPELRYYDGRLVSEMIWENGIARSHRTWYPDGQIEDELTCDSQGRSQGVHRMWNEDGTLRLEEPFKDGKYHGCRREQGHPDHWFWNGKSLGEGDYGKKIFEARSVTEK